MLRFWVVNRVSFESETTYIFYLYILGLTLNLRMMKTKMKMAFLALFAGFATNAQTIKANDATYNGAATTFGSTCVLVGKSAGNAASTGANNSFVGFESGKVNTTGTNNAFLGYKSGTAIVGGSRNTFLGAESGLSGVTSTDNTFVGYQAGKLVTGTTNTFVGSGAGSATTTGSFNTFLGKAAGSAITMGTTNTYIGGSSGGSNANVNGNTSIGYSSGLMIGNDNVFIGLGAGYSGTGSRNVLIGQYAGSAESPTLNDKLYIVNQLNETPLIWGDFASTQVKLNGKTGIGMPLENFPTTVGGASVTGYNLFVRGGILADEVRVRTTWSDYVFEDSYNLPTLEEVEKHIKEKGHLINVPSGKQVEEEGIEMGQMAKIQQEKIEELTLYLIQQNKEIAALKAQMKVLMDKKQ
jgi:hypothetical protein